MMDSRNPLTLERQALSANEIERLLSAAERFNEVSESEQVLQCIVQVAGQLLNVERVAIATNEGDYALRRFTWDNDAGHQTAVSLPLHGSIAGWVIRHGRPYLSNDLDADPKFSSSNKYHTVLSVPLVARDGSVLGALNLHQRRDGRGFSRQDERMAQSIAQLAAAALARSHAVERLRADHARYRALERDASDVVAVVDADGTLCYVSANADRALGIDAEQACGRPLHELAAPADAHRVRRILRRFAERGYARGRVRLQLPAASGQPRDVEVTATNRIDDRDVGGIVLSARDVTDSVRVERELKSRTRQLEAKAAEQEGFVREVSHALKTPLASIVAMSEVLEQDAEGLGGIWLDGLSLIRRVSARMESIINDLLKLARASAGLDELELRPIELDAVLDTACHEVSAQVAGRDAELEVASPLPVVLGHGGRLAEVFTNLLDNAIKYTPEGRRPKIEVWARTVGANVQCWVADNGIGIPAEHRQRVFELFRRLDSGRDLQTSGSGVGLAVAARIVERLGGRIWVEDSPLGGACFCVALQAAPPDARYPTNWVRAD